MLINTPSLNNPAAVPVCCFITAALHHPLDSCPRWALQHVKYVTADRRWHLFRIYWGFRIYSGRFLSFNRLNLSGDVSMINALQRSAVALHLGAASVLQVFGGVLYLRQRGPCGGALCQHHQEEADSPRGSVWGGGAAGGAGGGKAVHAPSSLCPHLCHSSLPGICPPAHAATLHLRPAGRGVCWKRWVRGCKHIPRWHQILDDVVFILTGCMNDATERSSGLLTRSFPVVYIRFYDRDAPTYCSADKSTLVFWV